MAKQIFHRKRTWNTLVSPQKLLWFTLLQHREYSKSKTVNLCLLKKKVKKVHSLIFTTECQVNS